MNIQIGNHQADALVPAPADDAAAERPGAVRQDTKDGGEQARAAGARKLPHFQQVRLPIRVYRGAC